MSEIPAAAKMSLMTTQPHTNSQLQTEELRLDAVVLRDLDVDFASADELKGGTRSQTCASNCRCAGRTYTC